MHSLDCYEMNKVEQSWTKVWNIVIESSLKVKFDKQIAENIKILLSVCEFVSLYVSEIWSYWTAYAVKKTIVNLTNYA